MSGVLDQDEYEYDDDRDEPLPEGSEWCDRCQGGGIANCYCGGDQCYCENYGEMECPTCHGAGWWVPTQAEIAQRAELAELMRKVWAENPVPPAHDSDGRG